MEEGQFITKKCIRYNIPGHAHELTFSCYRNRRFLLSERTCQLLIESIEKAREEHHFSLWAYVIMPDHVHLLIQPRDNEYNISNILKEIKTDPVRKGLVDEPGKWYYSSYNCWFNDIDKPIRIDKETWPLF